MSDLNNIQQHPLIRDGKSQNDRVRNSSELMPNNLQLDDRSDKNMLKQLYEFAKTVAHYDHNGTSVDNWQDFFRSGSSVQLALINGYNLNQFQSEFEDARLRLSEGLTRGDFKPLLDFLFESVLLVNTWQEQLSGDTEVVDGVLIVNENPIQKNITALVKTNLQSAFKRLVGIANIMEGYKLPYLEAILKNDSWNFSEPDIYSRDTALQRLVARPARFRASALQQLNEIFGIFNNAVRQIVSDTEGVSILQPTQVHEPHLGLLYTFLKLFNHVQNDFNNLTKRHLDFYYRRVLGLNPRPYTPDMAHVVFELSKPFSTLKLNNKTLLRDGKDAKKTDIDFALTDEIIVTRTQIATLRTLYNGVFTEKIDNKTAQTTTKLFAAPIANSADGIGGDFKENDDHSWATLGAGATRPNDLNGLSVSEMPSARVGLLIASPALRLAEGKRTITLTLHLDKPIPELVSTAATYKFTKKAGEFLKANEFEFTPTDKPIFVPSESSLIDRLISTLGINDDKLRFSNKKVDFTKLLEKTGTFDISLTGKKGWFKPTNVTFGIVATGIQIKIKLFVKDEPVVAADPSVLKVDFGVKEPLLKLELNQNILESITPNKYTSFYDYFSKVLLEKVELTVGVTDIKSMIARNDDGLLDASKAFMPFGAQPSVGSNFYIGSDEAFRKNLTDLTLDIVWDKLPKVSFEDHYKGYEIIGATIPTKDNLTFSAGLLNEGAFENISVTPQKLFNNTVPFASNPIHEIFKFSDFNKRGRITDPSVLTDLTGRTDAGFIKMTSGGDFLHSIYAQVVTQQALIAAGFDSKKAMAELVTAINDIKCTNSTCQQQIAAAQSTVSTFNITKLATLLAEVNAISCNNPNCAQAAKDKIAEILKHKPETINPPYTPLIKSLTIGYNAADTEGASEATLQVWHLHPFEEANHSLRSESGGALLPRYETDKTTEEPVQKPLNGTLFMGLKEANAGEVLNLLFQLNEPSADAYLPPSKVQWHYLKDNMWLPLQIGKHILSDETEGLIRSGIVKIVLPFDISTRATTILPPQYFWLRVATADNTDAICRALSVHTQAAKAIFKALPANDFKRLDVPLPAGSLKKLVDPRAEIKPPQQPYPSFGGRADEDDPAFYRRVSERLRHKGRAVTLWDYELLVLEAFPDIFKVKCIPHTLGERKTVGANDKIEAAGHITLVVVPNVETRPFTDRLEPKVSRSRLDDIWDFLKPRLSPFVRLTVMNPIFENINTAFKVKFIKGKSPEFYKKQLKEDICQFLAPWAYGEQEKLTFGGTIIRSSMVGYIERRDYVDYVEDFIMYKDDQEQEINKEEINKEEINKISTTTTRGILVSSVNHHHISIIE